MQGVDVENGKLHLWLNRRMPNIEQGILNDQVATLVATELKIGHSLFDIRY